jgi:hypothetical protein
MEFLCIPLSNLKFVQRINFLIFNVQFAAQFGAP